ncbi:hypothetical protein DLM77_05735 [Leptospira yasudae]|uniref:Uncharacterized protein n=1 Tax=Leptospira yasudae TaxID=2202201 RepID=A0ABX9M6P5_9LEPT|nr:hypothetical protein DLM77_05735 [Leptospira yasudae]
MGGGGDGERSKTERPSKRGSEFRERRRCVLTGGKVRKIFLYQEKILFASKKPQSCRNTELPARSVSLLR